MTSEQNQTAAERVLETSRIEALGDGIFAIAMTLLVLELRVPEPSTFMTGNHLHDALLELLPRLTSFFISFVILGIIWMGHRLQFHYINKSDRNILGINIILYFFVSLLPFSAALLGRYPHEQIATIIYGITLIVPGLVLFTQWKYAIRHKLTEMAISKELDREADKQLLFGPIMYSLAIAFSFWNLTVSLIIYALTPLYFILPNALDKHLPGKKDI